MSVYTEDTLVQQTTAEYLEQELGWQSVYAYNNEDFGPDSLLGRESDREVVLIRTLRAKIEELNPGLPATAYEDALRQIVTVSATQTMAATNREKYELIKDGVQVTFRNAKGERVRQRLRVFDFDNPDNNHFLCVRELWVRGDLYRRRADIVGFVNGLPLLFMELKNVSKDIRAAYERNFLDYKDTVPHLFHHNAVVVLANGVDAKLGLLTSRFEHFHEWKRLAENQPGVVAMETLLKGVCAKANFLDLVENFIVFDDSAGNPRKILARNHQFLGVNRAIEAVRDRKLRNGKLGVFWHTQGSGKSYSMVLFTRKVHRKLGGNFTFLILTDRDDLDTQIYKTFAGCGVVDNDRDPCRAASGEHLAQLLAQHKSHVFSLIQKFKSLDATPSPGFRPPSPSGRGAGGEGQQSQIPFLSNRDDIIAIVDEAHRTQYGTLALNMRNALPNASYIGFTGTPLFKDDEITRRVFGDYVSTYDFQRAVEDKATVPLYYDARGDKLGVAVGDLNERIAEKLEELETGNIDVEQRLEQELKRDYHIITAGKRLDQVARDFVQHYSLGWETGKAMLVCIDKITCVRMHKLVGFYWNERIGELEAQLPQATDEQDELDLRRQIEWMRQTQMAVVVSEEQGEVEKFRKWELDITPHRRLIKEGIDLPEAMRKQPQFQNMQRLSLDDAFKAEEHPFRVAIVCAMWLTGFDVPSLSTLYLDKPLKAHTLMQAIARANRINEGKNNGMIVDYCGILKNLRKALATFAGTGDDGRGGEGGETEPAKPDEELLADLREAIAFVRSFLEERSASLDGIIGQTGFARNAAILAAKEAANENDETRKRFEVMCRAVFSKFKACITIEGVNDCRSDFDAINIVYKSLQQDREQADITDIIRQLHQVVDEAIEVREGPAEIAEGVYDISKIDFDRLRREFERSPAKRTTVQNLKTAIEQRLQRLLRQNPLRTDFQRHYEEIVAEYNREKDRVTIEKTFEALLQIMGEMDDEESRAVREGLDEESLAVFDLLRKPDLTPGDIKRIKAVAIDLLETLKAEKLRIDHWRDKEATRDAVRLTIQDYLWSEQTGLPETYSEEDVRDKTEAVFVHVFRAYPTVPSPCYASMAS
ncbi:MAG: type I restriction endonuclease subunit R [Desulfuromonadales bacterium]|nr:type I restriction endonuclease subunit R [Desulfuromonadales bacterium]